VLKDSQAVTETAAYSHACLTLRKALQEKGILVPQGEHLVLTQDYTFSSPSSASGVLLGRSSNGRVEWKDEDGVSLRDLQSKGVEGEDG